MTDFCARCGRRARGKDHFKLHDRIDGNPRLCPKCEELWEKYFTERKDSWKSTSSGTDDWVRGFWAFCSDKGKERVQFT